MAQEKQEGKLKKLLKEAKRTISDLKAKIQSLTTELAAVKAELAQYKSVRGKLRPPPIWSRKMTDFASGFTPMKK